MMDLDVILAESSSVANLRLECQDGAVASHKIVVAGLSCLLRSLLADIPAGDEVTVIMPDFAACEVDTFLRVMSSQKERSNPGFSKLSQAFGAKTLSTNNESGIVMKSDINNDAHKLNPEENEVVLTKYLDNDSVVERTEIKCETNVYLDNQKEDQIEVTDSLDNDIVGRVEDVHDNSTAAAKAANINFEHQIEDLKKRLILNPVNESRVIRENNQRIECQLSILKAVRDLVYGKAETVAEAAKRYGAKLKSVEKFLKTGINYVGKGKKTKRATEEEELCVAERALELYNAGSYLSYTLLRNIFIEKGMLPESEKKIPYYRSGGGIGSRDFLRRFAMRHNLKKYFKSKPKYKNECDICANMYSTPKAVLDHKRQVHFSFLKSSK